MNQEVIQDFLNLPGIAGVALMDRHSRPYFCGVDQTLNFQQKEALAQGILQVLETIPDGFESFRFQFSGHQVYIYKLDHGIILLVLTRDNLVYSDYLQTIKNLKASLREDIANAIATFRMIAGSISLSDTNTLQGITSTSNNHIKQDFSPLIVEVEPVTSPVQPAPVAFEPPLESNGKASATDTTLSDRSISSTTQPPEIQPPEIQLSNSSMAEMSLSKAISSLNHLSQFSTQYLGTHVVVNYWKSTRPDHFWLKNFQIDRSAQISFSNATPQQLQQALTPEQQTWLKEWVAIFINRCSQVIRDLPNLIKQKALTDEQKNVLLG